jgi:hypothetical protein
MKHFTFNQTTALDYPTDAQELDWLDEIEDIMDTYENVKRELNRKLALANKYGYDEYADELAHLLEKLDMFRKSNR